MFCLRNYWSPAFASVKEGPVRHHIKFNCVVVCGARGPRPRYPRVWKTRKKIGTISKSQKLVECIKGLSNVKEEVYGALDSFVAWELEFPLIVVKKALKKLEDEKEWKRIIQVIKWMFNKGQGKTMGSYYTLLNALIEDGRIEEAEELFRMVFSRYMEGLPRTFFMRIISFYYSAGEHDKMFEIFADMEELGVRPDGSIIRIDDGQIRKCIGRCNLASICSPFHDIVVQTVIVFPSAYDAQFATAAIIFFEVLVLRGLLPVKGVLNMTQSAVLYCPVVRRDDNG
ncbi:hypothetical protein ACJX0J_018065, partial [Zea mays]